MEMKKEIYYIINGILNKNSKGDDKIIKILYGILKIIII